MKKECIAMQKVYVKYPVRYVVRGLLRTAAYAKETKQWPTYNKAIREMYRVYPTREATS